MADRESVPAIIPARGGSKALPRQNPAFLAGRPPVSYTVQAGAEIESIDRLVVPTEDREIAAVPEALGAEIVHRPIHLAEDTTPAEPVMAHALAEAESQTGRVAVVLLLQLASPVRGAERIEGCVRRVRSGEVDSGLTVCRDHSF